MRVLRWAVCVALAAASSASASSSMVDLAFRIQNPDPAPSSSRVAFSPASEHVYFADPNQGVLSYDRDPVTGLLSFVDVLEPVVTTNGIAVSSDGLHAYATDSVANVIHVMARDVVTGALSVVGATAQTNPKGPALSPDGAHVYVFRSVTGAGSIQVYERDAGSGVLTWVESEPFASEIDHDLRVGFSSDGLFLYAATGGHVNGISVFSRDPGTGELTPSGFPPIPVEVQGVAISPDDAHVYAADSDGVDTYARDGGTGALTLVERDVLASSQDRSRVFVSSDGAHVYVDGDEDPVVEVFSRDAGTGALTHVDSYRVQLGPVTRMLALSGDGGHLYDGASGFAHARDAGTGLLSFVIPVPRLLGAASGALSPDESHAYLASAADGFLTVAERDPVSGELTAIQNLFEGVAGVAGLDVTLDVAASGDGAHVYVAGYASDAIAMFARDPGTGLLAFLGTIEDGVGGVSGLTEPEELAISPDDAHVYVGAGAELFVFARDAGSGALTFVETHSAITAGMSFSPAGEHLYLVGSLLPGGLPGVHVFARDPGTGSLTYLSTHDGSGGGFGYPGGAFLSEVVCSGDGAHVYATGTDGDGVLLAFARDAGTGALTIVQPLLVGEAGFFDLGEEGLALRPDGHYLYASNPFTTFRRDPTTGRLAFVDQETYSGGSRTALAPTSDGALVYDFFGGRVYEHGFGCATAPLVGCKTGEVAKLTLSDSILDLKDKMIFVLTKGDETSESEFDPAIDNHFAFCLYDESGVPTLAYGALMPAAEDCRTSQLGAAKPCWSAGAVTKLKDRFSTPDGIRKATLKSGATGKAKILLKGAGENLREPTLPFGLPLRAQLQSAAGGCWEAVFATADKNESDRFKAKVKN